MLRETPIDPMRDEIQAMTQCLVWAYESSMDLHSRIDLGTLERRS